MIVSIHQPDYIPYIGYFYKIAQSDVFVFLDDAQFSSDNMQHWNKIKTAQGELRLKTPVENRFGMKINEVRTRDELKWKEKHLKTLEMNYSKAEYFNDVFPKYKELLITHYSDLATMNITINKFICESFGILPKTYLSSELNINTAREERVLDICEHLRATTYISGNGAKAYQIPENFEARGIELKYTDYHPFEYRQLWKEYIPNLSIMDYIFNNGFNWDKVIKGIRGV